MPKKSTRKRLTQRKRVNCTPKRRCTKGVEGMAEIIVNNARQIGLNVHADTATPGDGNCFYHAILQQLQRSEIVIDQHSPHLNLDPLPTHLELRVAICEYVQHHQNDIAYIQQYRTLYNNVLYEEYNLTWENFINEQSRNGVYVTELFIKTTAVLVGLNIHITSEYCTQQHPYNIVTSTWNNEETHNNVNSILIGNISGVHFQSLIPCDTGINYLSIEIESQEEQTSNRHQMVYVKNHIINPKPMHKNLHVSLCHKYQILNRQSDILHKP